MKLWELRKLMSLNLACRTYLEVPGKLIETSKELWGVSWVLAC
jgi:hypothetical protein